MAPLSATDSTFEQLPITPVDGRQCRAFWIAWQKERRAAWTETPRPQLFGGERRGRSVKEPERLSGRGAVWSSQKG
jgi:hypothetical protein